MKNLQLNSPHNKMFSIHNIIALLSFGIFIFSFSSCKDREGLSGMGSNDNPCIIQNAYEDGILYASVEVINGTDEYKTYNYTTDGEVSDIYHVKHNNLAKEWTVNRKKANGEVINMQVYKYSSDPYKLNVGEFYKVENSILVIQGSMQMTYNGNSSCSLTQIDFYNANQEKIGSSSIDYIDQNCSQRFTRTLYNPANGQVIGSDNIRTVYYDNYRSPGGARYNFTLFDGRQIDHNVISEEENGVQVFEATYTYNEQGYPITYTQDQEYNYTFEYICE